MALASDARVQSEDGLLADGKSTDKVQGHAMGNGSHDEPAFGDLAAGEFRKLFTRIANLLPAARGA